jgi:Ca2+/H+ antiporter
MWYLIGVVVVVVIGFFLYASVKRHKQNLENTKAKDNSSFRTEEKLSSYGKPMDDRHSHVDFDDAE